MAKKSKLRAALDAEKGTDYRLLRQKKLEKQAQKKKRSKVAGNGVNGARVVETPEAQEPDTNGQDEAQWETENSEILHNGFDMSHIDDTSSESSDGEAPAAEHEAEDSNGNIEANEDDEEDIPISDLDSLSSGEKEDILPHQRLTINNTTALLRAQNSIALPIASLPFSEHQSLTTPDPISIPDVDDDLNRELAFYAQSLLAVKTARSLLKKEGVPFSRPTDYFAEMVKSDEHMGKVKEKIRDAAASKVAAAEARKQRDLKKFGKQVQVAKQQERDKTRKQDLENIKSLKRKRQGADITEAKEADLFDVEAEDANESEKRSNNRRREREGQGGGRTGNKRQKRDSKYGYGGKKRHAKSGDAVSSSDLTRFSTKKMKGQKKGPQRLGKSRRSKLG
ncbi:MAG: rRNA-processing protein and EBNA1-binding protein ebp2 [Candelina submexicana]|nr:MAG: rRNA-processing protein and EBNA1-binding protein ebp2 [Candelina submexicana]